MADYYDDSYSEEEENGLTGLDKFFDFDNDGQLDAVETIMKEDFIWSIGSDQLY